MVSSAVYPIASRSDVEQVRRQTRALATKLGLDRSAVESVTIAVSELATNLARYADGGEIVLTCVQSPEKCGIRIESRDAGPGIMDLALAMRDGFSTGGGLGSGLPAVRRLMDDFAIESSSAGTTIVTSKWSAR